MNTTEHRTLECVRVCDALSDFLEGGLPPPVRQEVETHIQHCEGCAREARQLETLLRLLHQKVPRREPALDIWTELHPRVQQYLAEEKLSLPHRFRLRLGRFVGSVAAGAILFTQALAMNTEARMRKYLIHDPYQLTTEEEV